MNHYFGAGGGATHIATVTGLLMSLSSYKNTSGTNISKEILIVAGGGGGGGIYNGQGGKLGHGGGYIGVSTTTAPSAQSTGGTQEKTGISTQRNPISGSYISKITSAFGKGEGTKADQGCGGGGGWYGGGADAFEWGGSGGSGYIGSSNLISGGGITKHMTCYSCTTSTAAATRTNSNTNVSALATADYSKIGNGYARITYLGTSI